MRVEIESGFDTLAILKGVSEFEVTMVGGITRCHQPDDHTIVLWDATGEMVIFPNVETQIFVPAVLWVKYNNGKTDSLSITKSKAELRAYC